MFEFVFSTLQMVAINYCSCYFKIMALTLQKKLMLRYLYPI